MAAIGTKFGLGGSSGVHFTDPWLLQPRTSAPSGISIMDASTNVTAADTTAFFTEIANRGLQDTTNWTADTYKTILTVSSGRGVVFGYIGCTAGGTETHTVEFTVDGVVSTMAVVNAVTQRAHLGNIYNIATLFSGTEKLSQGNGNLDAGKTTLSAVGTYVMNFSSINSLGVPGLIFRQSLLIRAKHSATITNSTATAYSAVVYKLGLTA